MARTIAEAKNYWEPLRPRRYSRAYSGRGYSNPLTDPSATAATGSAGAGGVGALTLPHLSAGVEVYANFTSDNPLRSSDAGTATIKVCGCAGIGFGGFGVVCYLTASVYPLPIYLYPLN